MTTRRRRRGSLIAIGACIGAFVAGGTALVTAGASEDTSSTVSGPGSSTVTMTIDHSRFEPEVVRVRPHTTVRFVLENRDPIGHELIVGGPEVHARHRNGQEAHHAAKPGEVSVDAGSRASTTYTFHEPGRVEFACHLPRHYEYGMRGVVIVTDD